MASRPEARASAGAVAQLPPYQTADPSRPGYIPLAMVQLLQEVRAAQCGPEAFRTRSRPLRRR